jgi:ribonuclease HII
MLHSKHSHNALYHAEAGVDEAGRGCLAGPVVAAAVILPPNFDFALINDSKKLTENQRNAARIAIETQAIWAVGVIDNHRIDAINILNATYEAMHIAIAGLAQTPDFLLIDGNRFKTNLNIPFACEIKGDGRFANIAAASIIAKTYRDALMHTHHRLYPQYAWHTNKGYPTQQHRQAIAQHGLTNLHRHTFMWNKGIELW